MLRITLFLATNLGIIIMIGLALKWAAALGWLPREVLAAQGPLLVMAAIFGMGGAFVSLLLSKPMAKWSTGAVVIEHPRDAAERWLLETTAELAQAADIGMPEVAIYGSGQPNAFATGWNRNSSLIAVSEGLLDELEEHEIEAVLAHEVAHIANGDMVTLGLLTGVTNTFVILISRVVGSVVDRVIFRNERGFGPAAWITTMVCELAFGLLATMIVMAFSRHREFRADAGAAELVGARPMISALHRLSHDESGAGDLPAEVRAFAIAGGGFTRLFASHPPIAERIDRLHRGR